MKAAAPNQALDHERRSAHVFAGRRKRADRARAAFQLSLLARSLTGRPLEPAAHKERAQCAQDHNGSRQVKRARAKASSVAHNQLSTDSPLAPLLLRARADFSIHVTQ